MMDTHQDNASLSPPAAATQWRGFLRALVDELDGAADPDTRDLILRGVGVRMAQMTPMQPASSVETLQMEMNDALAAIGWGNVRLDLKDEEGILQFTHANLPRIGWAGDPPGSWLAPVLSGLYETWMGQQPGADAALVATIHAITGTQVVLHYGLPS